MPYFQLFALICFMMLLLANSNNKLVRFFIFILCYPLVMLEIVSVGLTQNLVDYRFFVHLSLNSLDLGFLFWRQIIIFAAIGIGIIAAFYWFLKRGWLKNLRKTYFVSLSILLFGVLLLPGGIGSNLFGIINIITAPDITFRNALPKIGISPNEYVTSKELEAKPGKNIIVISMESLERGFIMGNAFPKNLTPNLRNLSRNWTFYSDMAQGPGSGWTAGSMYTVQTGFPAFFKGHGNDYFQHASNSKIIGLGNVLKVAGYKSIYLMGRPEFAGELDILKLFGFEVVSEKNSLGKYPQCGEGLHDLDVFSEAKLQIKKMKRANRPFALFISTVDTHFPNGIYDSRMKSLAGNSGKGLAFCVSALDYLVGDFISYLKVEGLLNDTAVFLFPDHEMMGNGPVVKKYLREGRSLYMITNVNENQFPKGTNEKICQIDLPRMIIAGAGIQSNAKFLSDFLRVSDPLKFLKRHARDLSALNFASLRRDNFRAGISLSTRNHHLILSSGKFHIQLPLTNHKKDQAYDVLLSPRADFVETKSSDIKTAFLFNRWDKDRLHLIVKARRLEKSGNYDIIAYFGNKNRIGVFSKGENEVKFSQDLVNRIIMGSKEIKKTFSGLESANVTKNISQITLSPDVLQVTSSGFLSLRRTPSVFKLSGKDFRLTRGLSVFFQKRGEYMVETFDTHGKPEDAKKFVKTIKSMLHKGAFFAVAASDSAEHSLTPYKKELMKLGFLKLSHLGKREPYVAYSFGGKVNYELTSTSNTTISCIVPVLQGAAIGRRKIEVKSRPRNRLSDVNRWKKDRDRFIAHAGGQIGHHRYTDSLQALDHSYERGFRLFELDISKTSDNFFVATHDWKTWAKQTGYEGPLSPTKGTFKKYKIYGRYMPLDMNDINEWFREHSDAILITDKVNNPVEFSEQFVDKRRLRMELFSLSAVKAGLKKGVVVMPNLESVVLKIKGDKVSVLKKMGVQYVTASRRNISKNLNLFKKLKSNGIKVYVFHVNFDKGKDENYVVNNEFQYVYGMYADRWEFE